MSDQSRNNVQNGETSTEQPMSDQLNAAEDLCNDLLEENKQLKMEIQGTCLHMILHIPILGLHQEVDEMQDQYREEEIEGMFLNSKTQTHLYFQNFVSCNENLK
jgi:hypothetical protein